VPEELDTAPSAAARAPSPLPGLALLEASCQRYRAGFSEDEIRQRRATAERELDALLGHFVAAGYQPEIDDQRIEIVNSTLIDFAMHQVYVLPGDLLRLLDDFGMPLMHPDTKDEEVPVAGAPFDLRDAPQGAGGDARGDRDVGTPGGASAHEVAKGQGLPSCADVGDLTLMRQCPRVLEVVGPSPRFPATCATGRSLFCW
jgi:hypothetical protein